MPRLRRVIKLRLPEEFIERCACDGVLPEVVLRGFIADLCDLHGDAEKPRMDGYACHGSDERFLAQEYYKLAGYRGGKRWMQ